MGLTLTAGMVIALDSSPLIYWIEQHPRYRDRLANLFDRVSQLGVHLVTSMVTYIEVLTLPERMGRSEIAAQYRLYLTQSARLTLAPLDLRVADEAIRYRATLGVTTPDAIQLGVARVHRANFLLTNDATLKRCEDVPVVMVEDLQE